MTVVLRKTTTTRNAKPETATTTSLRDGLEVCMGVGTLTELGEKGG
jgi:hypothetical protein